MNREAPVTGRGALNDRVYQYVKQQLFESVYRPGEWLSIDAIAQACEVSRQPVLEGMKRLAVDGFVVIVPQVGCQVRSYGIQEIQDFYRLLAEGEALIADMATQRCSHEDLITLRGISNRIGDFAQSDLDSVDLARLYRTLNREFHGQIRRMARSPSMTEVVERMGDRSDFFIAMSGRPLFGETLSAAHAEHDTVLKAMEARDATKAAKTMRQHIVATSARLQKFWREQAKNGTGLQAVRG